MDAGRMRILLVDDDASDRKLMKRLLSRNGHVEDFVEYEDAQEALEQEKTRFDAIFIDHNLSGSTGLSFLSEMRDMWPRAAIFLMTGLGDETIAKSAIQEGATDYVSKNHLTAPNLERMLVSGMGEAEKRWRVEQQRIDLATFSEVLVHDFKAPIRAASYLAEQIGEDLDAGQISDVHDGLRLLKKSADQMREMISSLSDHIRLDREIEYARRDADQLVEGARTALALELREASVELDVDIDDDLPAIMCNGPQISQVLQNLIANAVKFSSEDSARVAVRVYGENDRILFEIADTGCGIPKEHLEDIFLPFTRGPGASKVGGTGLGLATCRKIVLRHDGRIWCNSVVGKGTRMFFSLPVNQSRVLGPPLTIANTPERHSTPARRLGL